jgi:glycosyltransferase involved in cell wall biosynthesis
MSKVKRLIMLNQMAGPLFCELAEGLSNEFPDGVVLHTGHPDAKNINNNATSNIQLITAPEYNRKSRLTRVLSWMWYLISTTKLILFAKRSDGYLLSSNPPILGIWFWLLNFFKKNPYIVLVYDIHPDVLVEMGVVQQNNIIVKIWNWLNKKVYRDSKSIVTLGKHMAKRLSTSNDLSLSKISTIPPWVDTDFIKPLAYENNPLAKNFNPEGKHVVLYSGNMGISHDIDSMLGAAKQLRNRDDILFLFIGDGDKYQTVVDYQKSHQLDNIAIYPYQEESDLPYTMTLASISLVALDGGAQELMIPSKVFYYMAAGSAIIGICSGESELNDIINTCDCGVCMEPGNPKSLANKIEKLLQNPKELDAHRYNSRKLVIDTYGKEIGIKKFISLFSGDF